ncbi:MAG TPA: hypothetical protein VG733_03295 [Chthoniobacteraceae bacterium]|nr:hypothetical protein [Chthoniobacteraceae bacterium]
MKTKTSVALAFMLIMGACVSFAQESHPTRAQFAAAMSKVKEGMSAADAEKLLGKPDDVRTERDPGGLMTYRTSEIWGYGTDGHLSFPTLGCVYISEGAVQYVFGGGQPPDPAMFDEATLRKLLRLLAATYDDNGRNPLRYIQAVNTLLPLGKEKALALIGEFTRVESQDQPVPTSYDSGFEENLPLFLTLRLLFEVPVDPGYMPRMLIGGSQPMEPKDPKLLPLFPIALVKDIPLVEVISYFGAGEAQPVQDHIDYFRKNGVLRKQPLHPPDDPLAALEQLEHSPQWIFKEINPGDTNWGRYFLANQLLALVNTVYHIEPEKNGNPLAHFDAKQWDKIKADVAALHIKWDATKNIYVLADGTTLPEQKKPVYMRQIFDVPSLGADARLVIERQSKETVDIQLYHAGNPGIPTSETTVKIFRDDDPKAQPLANYHIPAYTGNGNSSSTDDNGATLPAGTPLHVEITSGGKTTKLDPVTP